MNIVFMGGSELKIYFVDNFIRQKYIKKKYFKEDGALLLIRGLLRLKNLHTLI